MKITTKTVVDNLKGSCGLLGALSIAEAAVNSLNGGKLGWTYSDLPDYRRIADDSQVADSSRKKLYQMEAQKPKELTRLQNFWKEVAAILRKQAKN